MTRIRSHVIHSVRYRIVSQQQVNRILQYQLDYSRVPPGNECQDDVPYKHWSFVSHEHWQTDKRTSMWTRREGAAFHVNFVVGITVGAVAGAKVVWLHLAPGIPPIASRSRQTKCRVPPLARLYRRSSILFVSPALWHSPAYARRVPSFVYPNHALPYHMTAMRPP